MEQTLQGIFASRARFLLLNRLALSTGELPIFTVQESLLSANGQGPLPQGILDRTCRYPVTYYPLDKLEEFFSPHYRILMKYEKTRIAVIEDQRIISLGYFAKLQPLP